MIPILDVSDIATCKIIFSSVVHLVAIGHTGIDNGLGKEWDQSSGDLGKYFGGLLILFHYCFVWEIDLQLCTKHVLNLITEKCINLELKSEKLGVKTMVVNI